MKCFTAKKMIAFVMAVAIGALCGCGAAASGGESTQPPTPSSLLPESGSNTACPPPVQSIISLSPANTVILTALGLGDKLVAVDSYSTGIEGVPAGIPEFDMMTPDTEALVALGAEIIFTTDMSAANGEDPFKPVREAGAFIVDMVTPDSIEGIKENITRIGQVTGRLTKANELVAEMDRSLKEVSAIGSGITEKKSVLFEIAAAPAIYSFGSGVFLNEMLELVGAVNILEEQQGWVSVSEETVLAANPDVILTNIDYIDDPVGEIKARSGWDSIDAVKTGQVYFISSNESSQATHNIIIALREMAKAIYPEAYASLS